MQTSPKAGNHHYVPQVLLKYFRIDGDRAVWVHERGRTKPYRKGPRRIAGLPDFYAVEESSGLDEEEIEKFLGIPESWIAPIIAKMQNKSALTDVDRERFAIFTAFTQIRGPRFKTIVDDFEERVARKVLHTAVADDERAKVALKHTREELGEEIAITSKQFREFILDDSRYEVSAHKHSAIRMMLEMAPEIAQFIFGMPWLFCHAAGCARFVTSDVPVVLADPANPPSLWNWSRSPRC